MEDISNEKRSENDFISWYDAVAEERLSMVQAEEGYQKRISELEQNTSQLLKEFEQVQKEVVVLRQKYEPGDDLDVYKEPYRNVCVENEKLLKEKYEYKTQVESLERDIKLRKKEERFFKNRIETLEHENQLLTEYNNMLVESDKGAIEKKRPNNLHKRIVVVTGPELSKNIEHENVMLKNRVNKLKQNITSITKKQLATKEQILRRESHSTSYSSQWEELRNTMTRNSNGLRNIAVHTSPEAQSRHARNDQSPRGFTKTQSEPSSSPRALLPPIQARTNLMFGLGYQTIFKQRAKRTAYALKGLPYKHSE